MKEGSGGLVTALAPVLRNRGGVWIGWPGSDYNEEVESLLASSAGKYRLSAKASKSKQL